MVNCRSRALAGLVLSSLLISACAVGYHGRTCWGGYSEHCPGSRIWTVSFEGNGFMRFDTVRDFMLYRASEVAAEQGFDFFAVGRTIWHDSYYEYRNLTVHRFVCLLNQHETAPSLRIDEWFILPVFWSKPLSVASTQMQLREKHPGAFPLPKSPP